MLTILRKTAASLAKSTGSAPSVAFDDDLSVWEFVNAAFSDDEDGVFSFDGDDVIRDAPESEPDQRPVEEVARSSRDFVNPKIVIYSITCLSGSPRASSPIVMTRGADGDGGECDEDLEDEHDVDDHDFDDELVPWKLKHMLGKQRIRKMGKKGGPKLTKSKKQPYYPNRPGCLYGKHGFGVQHSFV